MSLNKPEVKFPKPDPLTNRDSLGIRYEGPVLTGMLGLNQKLEDRAAASPQTSAQIREIAPGGATYIPPEQFLNPGSDPRLTPDPAYAYQRSQLPHPSLADPVIRHHLNLPPLPDPYEQRRQAAEAFEKLKKEGKIITNW
jgi:hypothetical protein